VGAGSSEPVVRVLVGGVHWCSFPGLCFRLVASGQPFLQCSLRTSLGSCLVEALATWQLSRQLTQNRVHTSSPNLSRQMLAAFMECAGITYSFVIVQSRVSFGPFLLVQGKPHSGCQCLWCTHTHPHCLPHSSHSHAGLYMLIHTTHLHVHTHKDVQRSKEEPLPLQALVRGFPRRGLNPSPEP
jgi:hypothetical protein